MLATGGIGKSYQVTSNSWEYTGDGHALAMRAGASLINMEFVQFHPTGMVWPLSVRGLLVTESVRGDGGVLKNSEGERFMFNYIPEFFKAETADTVEEATPAFSDSERLRADLVSALQNLGYHRPQAEKAVDAARAVSPDATFDSALRQALRELMR